MAYQKDDEESLIYDERRIEVAGRDLDDVVLNLVPAASVRGVVESDAVANGRPPRFQLHLVPQDLILEEIGAARWSSPASAQGFAIPSVPAGKYWVDFESGDGQYIASARAGDTDLLAAREMVISAAGEPANRNRLAGRRRQYPGHDRYRGRRRQRGAGASRAGSMQPAGDIDECRRRRIRIHGRGAGSVSGLRFEAGHGFGISCSRQRYARWREAESR